MIIAAAVQATAAPPAPPCPVGSYQAPDGELLFFYPNPEAAGKFRFKFIDGRAGDFGEPNAPMRCQGGRISALGTNGRWMAWRQQQFRITNTHFQSEGVTFAGQLFEPADARGKVPLAVMVGGSEHWGMVGKYFAYTLAAQGIAAFVYDKRGTGGSGGQYTQDFALLGADAAAAMNEAKRLDAGRYSRAGFTGASQGGWVAPLGAYLSHADFVVVSYGLVLTPLEEDSEQVYDELRRKGFGPEEIAEAHEVTEAVDHVVASHFTSGYEGLAAVKRKFAGQRWFHEIEGEFTGDVLKADEQTLRTKGRDLYDNLQIDWHYDALGWMRKLNIPQLWILAGADRDAPNGLTVQRLALLQREGKPIQVMIFPHTDHGIQEFTEAPDGTRTDTKTADGYYPMIGDWIKGQWRPPYGDSFPIQGTPPPPPVYSHP